MLKDRLKKGLKMTGVYMGDDDSGLDVDTEAIDVERPIDPDKLSINLKVTQTGFFFSFFLIQNSCN